MSLRYLFVDVNASFVNPTRNLIPLALLNVGGFRFFGPGYVSSEVLARGLKAYVEEEGPFDLVVSNTLVLFSDTTDPARYAATLRAAYAYQGAPDDLLFLPIIASQFSSLTCPRAALLLENDFYNWTAQERDRIEACANYFIGFGEEFSPLQKEMPHLKEERFAAFSTDIWANFVRDRRDQIASLLHFVSDAEFDLTPLSLRGESWSVMGVQYHARQVARDALKAIGVDPVIDSRLRKLVSLFKKTGVLRGEKRWIQKALNADFSNRIAATRYSYTCGSGLMMPIRKFFEIPAAGSVLVCRPFAGFEAAGFRDGENCIVAEPQNLAEIHAALKREPDRAECIARTGQQLVLNHHSLTARADDLALIFDSIAERQFKGSVWQNGRHRLRARAERSMA